MDDDLLHRFVAERRLLLAYLRSMLPPVLVEDAYHETFLVVSQKLDAFDRTRDFGRWVRGIARLVAKRVAAQARKTVPASCDLLADRIDQAFDEAPTEDPYTEHLARLRVCLDRLTPPQRELLQRRFVENASYQALAADSGRTPGAVQVAVSRLRAVLASCIGVGLEGA